jgi:WhiB family redox-sensing transcriptional regulator
VTTRFFLPLFDGDAACAEVGGDEWFPDPGGEGVVVAQAARDVCNRCEIKVQCGAWAIALGEPYGIWGGLTEIERRRLSGRRRAS